MNSVRSPASGKSNPFPRPFYSLFQRRDSTSKVPVQDSSKKVERKIPPLSFPLGQKAIDAVVAKDEANTEEGISGRILRLIASLGHLDRPFRDSFLIAQQTQLILEESSDFDLQKELFGILFEKGCILALDHLFKQETFKQQMASDQQVIELLESKPWGASIKATLYGTKGPSPDPKRNIETWSAHDKPLLVSRLLNSAQKTAPSEEDLSPSHIKEDNSSENPKLIFTKIEKKCPTNENFPSPKNLFSAPYSPTNQIGSHTSFQENFCAGVGDPTLYRKKLCVEEGGEKSCRQPTRWGSWKRSVIYLMLMILVGIGFLRLSDRDR